MVLYFSWKGKIIGKKNIKKADNDEEEKALISFNAGRLEKVKGGTCQGLRDHLQNHNTFVENKDKI